MSQCSHSNSFSPECVLLWVVRMPDSVISFGKLLIRTVVSRVCPYVSLQQRVARKTPVAFATCAKSRSGARSHVDIIYLLLPGVNHAPHF